MALSVCYLAADASVARAVTGAAAATWVASDSPAPAGPAAPGGGVAAGTDVRRISDAAAWAASQAPPSQRFDVVCIGVGRSLCTWISAPSTERQVILAAVRQRDQDWGGAGMAASVQSLAAEAGGAGRTGLRRRTTHEQRASYADSPST